MGTKKNFDIVLFIYVIFASMLLISPAILASSDNESEVVTRVFHSTGAEMARLQVNGWVRINEADVPQGLAAVYLNDRIQRLSKFGFIGAVNTGYDGHGPILVAEGTIDPAIYVKVVLRNAADSNEIGRNPMYLTVSVITQNRSLSLTDLNKYLLLIIPEKEIHRSMILAGSLPGNSSPPVVNEVVRKLVSITGTQNVETLVNGQLVSITGYMPNVRTRLTLGEKLVNINIAFRYNSIENRTYLYVGSPIITTEY